MRHWSATWRCCSTHVPCTVYNTCHAVCCTTRIDNIATTVHIALWFTVTAPAAHPVNREHSHACREELRTADDRREHVGFITYALHPTVQCSVQRNRLKRSSSGRHCFDGMGCAVWTTTQHGGHALYWQFSMSNVAGQRMLPVYNRQYVHGYAPRPADEKIAVA